MLYKFSGRELASVPEPSDSVLSTMRNNDENVGSFTSEQTWVFPVAHCRGMLRTDSECKKKSWESQLGFIAVQTGLKTLGMARREEIV